MSHILSSQGMTIVILRGSRHTGQAKWVHTCTGDLDAPVQMRPDYAAGGAGQEMKAGIEIAVIVDIDVEIGCLSSGNYLVYGIFDLCNFRE